MKRFLIIMQSFSAQCNSFYFHCFLAMDVLWWSSYKPWGCTGFDGGRCCVISELGFHQPHKTVETRYKRRRFLRFSSLIANVPFLHSCWRKVNDTCRIPQGQFSEVAWEIHRDRDWLAMMPRNKVCWMRSEKVAWQCFRTGVRLPSSPPIENKPCFGLRRHRMEHRIHAVLFGCTARLRQIKGL